MWWTSDVAHCPAPYADFPSSSEYCGPKSNLSKMYDTVSQWTMSFDRITGAPGIKNIVVVTM